MANINAGGDHEVARFQRYVVPPTPAEGEAEIHRHVVVLTAHRRILERTSSGWKLRGTLSCDLPVARDRLERAGWTPCSSTL
jgi:hypothetical protein